MLTITRRLHKKFGAQLENIFSDLKVRLAARRKKLESEEQEKTKIVSIYRYDPEACDGPYFQDYELDREYVTRTVLDQMFFIKNEIDSTLSFRRSCGEGLCGSCAVNINGVNRLACITPMPRGDLTVFPLPHCYVIRDLVVDLSNFYRQHKAVQPWLQRLRPKPPGVKEYLQSTRDRAKLDGLYECLLCGCCSFACPTYWHHGTEKNSFLGPAAILQCEILPPGAPPNEPFCRLDSSMCCYQLTPDSYTFLSSYPGPPIPIPIKTNGLPLDNRFKDECHTKRLERLKHSVYQCRKIINCTNACPKGLNPAMAVVETIKLMVDLEEKEEPDLEQSRAPSDDAEEAI